MKDQLGAPWGVVAAGRLGGLGGALAAALAPAVARPAPAAHEPGLVIGVRGGTADRRCERSDDDRQGAGQRGEQLLTLVMEEGRVLPGAAVRKAH